MSADLGRGTVLRSQDTSDRPATRGDRFCSPAGSNRTAVWSPPISSVRINTVWGAAALITCGNKPSYLPLHPAEFAIRGRSSRCRNNPYPRPPQRRRRRLCDQANVGSDLDAMAIPQMRLGVWRDCCNTFSRRPAAGVPKAMLPDPHRSTRSRTLRRPRPGQPPLIAQRCHRGGPSRPRWWGCQRSGLK